MSRAVLRDAFGGPEVLQVREVPEPHAGPGEIRVAVRAAGLNPMDWQIAGSARHAAMFGITGPSGFGCDLAGVVDEVGQGVTEFAPGDRVYGGVLVGAVADHVVLRVPLAPPNLLRHTPDGIDDATAAALPTPGLTAAAALDAIRVGPSDTVLVGGAAGGVGVLAVQLAGATVIGTGSPGTFDFLERLGAVPVTYGAGLADRVRALAPDGITAATDLHGTETAETALALGVPPARISTIAADRQLPGVHATGAFAADPAALERIADLVAAGAVTVPIAESFPLDRIREAVALQAGGHVHGKIVVTL
ncbi:NADP-dependent oxidoreductase [Amycolatopsis tucumanensis]|uniref:NADP-dependent oxidoreductase n=1 Tax=Amycolatopsis tucumanensis TaxID=401106 RepID=A0ABP7HCD7_9PSEU|nr:NADP-dependent oxidoreductase [Amycolatopsis tucumanensis]MCF6423766.1 NADP-dependent oxidoreductase [Amycolatopsis tucumanensis]